jgi:hypothetical protein
MTENNETNTAADTTATTTATAKSAANRKSYIKVKKFVYTQDMGWLFSGTRNYSSGTQNAYSPGYIGQSPYGNMVLGWVPDNKEDIHRSREYLLNSYSYYNPNIMGVQNPDLQYIALVVHGKSFLLDELSYAAEEPGIVCMNKNWPYRTHNSYGHVTYRELDGLRRRQVISCGKIYLRSVYKKRRKKPAKVSILAVDMNS